MSDVLAFLGLFAVGGFVFGRIWRRFFRRRRIGVGRFLLGRFLLLSFFIIFGMMYVGLLGTDDPEAKLDDSERMLATWGLPIVFLLFAVVAYRIGTRARVVTKKSAGGFPGAQQPDVAPNDVWSQPTASPAAPAGPPPAVLPPPMIGAQPVRPAAQLDGPYLPPRA